MQHAQSEDSEYSLEGELYSFDLRERRHVHVFRERMECKIWIENGIETAWNRGFPETELNDILRMVEKHLIMINGTYEQLLAGN